MFYNRGAKNTDITNSSNDGSISLQELNNISIERPIIQRYKRQILAVPLLIIIDIVAFSLSIFVAFVIRALFLPMTIPLFHDVNLFRMLHMLDMLWWMPLLACVLFAFEKLYAKRVPFWQEAGQIVKATTLFFLLAICIIFLTKLGDLTSRTVVLIAWGISLVTVPTVRYVGKLVLLKLRIWEKPVIIVGAGETGALVLNAICSEPTLGYRPVGFLDDDKTRRTYPPKMPSGQEVPVLGSFEQAETIMENNGVRDVIVAVPGLQGKELVQLTNRLQRKAYNLLLVPDLFGIAMANMEVQCLFNERAMVLKFKNNLNDRLNLIFKRIFDLVLSFIILPAILPVMLVTAIAIKLDSKGPLIFTGKRIGKNGKDFSCYKFRSMYVDSDKILQEYLSYHADAKKQWMKYAKLKNYDPRVTKVGVIIRKLSIDELPQIFNVIKGNMSLVGPRPYLPHEWNMVEGRDDILLTRPGITGFWQVNGRNEVKFEDRLKMDSWYVRNWSLWLDIVFLLRTITVVIKGKGAY